MSSRIPLPDPSKWGDFSDILQNIMQNRLAREQMAQTGAYQQGTLQQQANQLAETSKYHQQELAEKAKEFLAKQKQQELENAYIKEQNPFKLAYMKAQIAAENALAKQRGTMSSGLGTGGKEELFFQKNVGNDNPQLKGDPSKIYEASNALREGRDTLSDGTKLNDMSPATRASFDRLTKGTTYAGAAVPLLKANQAEAELKVLGEMSNKDFEPFATTYAGYSIPQIVSTFKRDDESQEKLGNFIASQAAQYEMSQLRNRLARGEPGITATQELMGKSGQIIKTLYPSLSAKARMQASKRLDEYLEAALKASKSVGLGASSASTFNKSEKSNNNDPLGIR